MSCRKLSNEFLSRCKYPNLIAEVMESTYSICTIAEYMELGRHRKEDDPEVWGMLNGTIQMERIKYDGDLQMFPHGPGIFIQ